MDKMNEYNIELSKYIKQGILSKEEKIKIWKIAIGLQAVDGLVPSNYLIDIAREHIEGNIDISEVINRINNYYDMLVAEDDPNIRTEEADKVSARIVEVLSENSFHFSITEILNIHKRLFADVLKNAGEFRKYNITKKESVLDGDTVIYSSYEKIKETLDYDLEQERNFSYKDLTIDELVKHISTFTANIWQVHPFREGNTRTIAVFIIKYLRTLGFDINNEPFDKNALYFRNALVRANYTNYEKHIFETTIYLEKFFSNLLKGTNYELRNEDIHLKDIDI